MTFKVGDTVTVSVADSFGYGCIESLGPTGAVVYFDSMREGFWYPYENLRSYGDYESEAWDNLMKHSEELNAIFLGDTGTPLLTS